MGLRRGVRGLAKRVKSHALATWVRMAGPRHTGASHGLPGPLVISLTSYPKRYPTLDLTLICLLRQTVKADKIILWVGEQAFKALPSAVLHLQKYGLEIRPTEDIGPFTKIIPALRQFRSAFIVTADDDLYYSPKWLAGLVTTYDPRTPQIICHRAHLPGFRSDGAMTPYRTWEWESECTTDSGVIFPTGVGGVLYPPNALPPQTLDESIFLSLCPRQDDVWLYFMGRRVGARYRTVGAGFRLMDWAHTQEVGLSQSNVVQNVNDLVIQALEAHLGPLGPSPA